MARCLEAKFNRSKASDTAAYESPTRKLFKKLEQEKQDAEQTVAKKQHEVFELESSFKSLGTSKKPLCLNGPFATNDHMVQNPPYWRASSLLFPHWDINTMRLQPVKRDWPLF